MAKPLAIVPTYLREGRELLMTATCLKTLRATAGDQCDVLVVDDGSPADDLVEGLQTICKQHDAELLAAPENSGFSTTVNVGLRRALYEERDAVLVNNDLEFGLTKDWLRLMVDQRTEDGEDLASVVGALLLYPTGLIQHAGIFFSYLTRTFDHRYRFGPGNLPEAQHAGVMPVTGALQFIRLECLQAVGIYDETFRLGYEDVDYNVRVWQSGRQCVYQPGVRAVHHESATRGRKSDTIAKWEDESWRRFCAKWADTNFAEWIPMLTMQLD